MPQTKSSQQSAIEKIKGPCIILAGAGTGKTHTIVEKIAHLLKSTRYNPEKIVCLTFSNEAANEMRKRILPLVKDKEPIIKTFHSFSVDLLRKHGSLISISEDFKILLPDDAKILLHKSFKTPPMNCHKYIGAIGNAKDLCIAISDVENFLKTKTLLDSDLTKKLENLQFQLQVLHTSNHSHEQEKELKEQISALEKIVKLQKFLQTWKGYEKLKTKQNQLDYSDLNQKSLELLSKYPEIANDYEYIIVDEFQDTNKLQCDFLEKIAPHRNITVVGDLNQSIYRFRGAYKHNLEQFKKSFKIEKSDIFALDKSYRSTDNVLKVAHKLILNNYENKEDCFPIYSALNLPGSETEVHELKNSKEEVRKIIEIIKSELESGIPAEEICVLFRTHQQSRALKTSLESEKIPFTSVTKKSLLKITPIKITKDYLTILDKIKSKSKGGEQAWWDLIFNSNFPKEDAIKIGQFLKNNKYDKCLSQLLLNNLSNLAFTEQGKIKSKLILKQIKNLLPYADKSVPEIILKIYEVAGLNNQHRKNKEILLVLQKFHELSQEYSELEYQNLGSFIHHLEIINNLGIEVEAPSIDNSGIRIMTQHATKGLEYNTVIISNLAQKRFPMERISSSIIPPELSPELSQVLENSSDKTEEIVKAYEQTNQLLEERRLCYVAFTRAKRKLFLTYAKQYGNRKFHPSQFLNEIEYQKNNIIKFQQDNQELFLEPKTQFHTASDLNKILNSSSPSDFIPDNNPSPSDGITFSPSSLKTFDECQKRYEYKYVYNMPDPTPTSWEAMKLGSFVHSIFEDGVKSNFQTEKQFLDHAKILQAQDKWSFIDLDEAIPLIRVFFHRNKNKYDNNSITEGNLYAEIGNLNFSGRADRIDINKDKELEIIDYKTGSSDVKPKYRNWQLGFYAIAAKSLGTPKRLTLDMLKKEKPVEFHIDNKGNAIEIHSQRTSFNLEEVKEELVHTANQILNCYDAGFKPCAREKACSFCDEYVWED